MTDLEKDEIIISSDGKHYKFVSLENTQEEADALCEKLMDMGFQPATFQREDNGKIEVFIKFTTAQEIVFELEQKHCVSCPPEKKAKDCTEKACKIKGEIVDTLWKEELGFFTLLEHKLKKVKEAGVAA